MRRKMTTHKTTTQKCVVKQCVVKTQRNKLIRKLDLDLKLKNSNMKNEFQNLGIQLKEIATPPLQALDNKG